MLSWWMKILSHSINIWDVVTYVVPLYSVYQARSYERIFTLLAPVSTMLAVHVSSRTNNMLKWANFGENQARLVKLGSYNGAWYTEHNGKTFVTVSQIFIEWGQCFVRHDNIWQTIVWLMAKRMVNTAVMILRRDLTYWWRRNPFSSGKGYLTVYQSGINLLNQSTTALQARAVKRFSNMYER